MKYKTVFIDWDGTLSNSRFWAGWMGTERYAAIQQVLFVESKQLVDDWMTGLESTASIVKYVESRTGIPYVELLDELKHSAENMQFIHDDTTNLVKQLQSKGVKVVIATDNMDTFHNWTTPAMKLDTLFDDILVSDTNAALKTHINENGISNFFHPYLKQHKLEAGDTVLIDNSIDINVQKFGMRVLHVNDEVSLRDHLLKIIQEN